MILSLTIWNVLDSILYGWVIFQFTILWKFQSCSMSKMLFMSHNNGSSCYFKVIEINIFVTNTNFWIWIFAKESIFWNFKTLIYYMVANARVHGWLAYACCNWFTGLHGLLACHLSRPSRTPSPSPLIELLHWPFA